MDQKAYYHFIGIGGVGMSALAILLLEEGLRVSGSDVKETDLIARLRIKGARIAIGHHADNIQKADYVVYSSAIREDNPEMLKARQEGITILKRAQLLAQLMEKHVAITVAGMHGKTTTTSMIAHVLTDNGFNPTTAVGGMILDTKNNAKLGRGEYFVAEVDESDGSFLCFHPNFSVITNIDFEHVDYYHNWDNILAAFKRFIGQTQGKVIGWGEDARLKELMLPLRDRAIFFGLSPDCDVRAESIRHCPTGMVFQCIAQNRLLGEISIPVFGQHNVRNALACIAVGRCLHLDFSRIGKSLKTFPGVQRRFQTKGCVNNIRVMDDYGHHPTEIAETLKTAQLVKKGKLHVVFQPHRYTRTQHLMDEFVRSLSLSDALMITDIYAASEKPIEGVTAEALCRKFSAGGVTPVYLPKEKIVEYLLTHVMPGDTVMTLGAGDIYQIGEQFLKALEHSESRLCDAG